MKRQLAAQRAHIEHAAKVDAASQKQPFELHWWHTYWLDNKLPWPEALSAIESVAVPEMNLVSVIVAVPEASVKVAAETSDLAVLLDWSYKVAEVSKQQGAACWRWKVLDLALQPSGRYSARLIGVCNQKRTKQLGG
ncbi:hypothetical protein [Rubrivivax gelatinosus]|uniref:hypothetical protein n=1 Tax=Rubrivivax gelatinosus TaxID=28068 RepID=UPI00104773DF|nr:hypothetical protein [Rubrivivax gelatinosus]